MSVLHVWLFQQNKQLKLLKFDSEMSLLCRQFVDIGITNQKYHAAIWEAADYQKPYLKSSSYPAIYNILLRCPAVCMHR